MSIPFWDDGDGAQGPTYLTNPWDTMRIGDRQLPGYVEVDVQPSKKADQKKAAASHGSSVTVHGYDPARVVIKVTIWTADQFTIFSPINQTLWPRPGKDAPIGGPQAVAGTSGAGQAFDVSHPECDLYGIRSVIILSASIQRARVGRTFVYNCIELVAPVATHAAKVTQSTHEPLVDQLDPDKQKKAANAPQPPSSDPSVTGP